MLSGLEADKYFLESLTLSSSCFSTGTSNKTFISKSASFLYLFVKIEPIKPVLIIGYSFSNSDSCLSICALTLGLIFGLSVSASSNTLGAYVLLGISMILSNIFSLNDFIIVLLRLYHRSYHWPRLYCHFQFLRFQFHLKCFDYWQYQIHKLHNIYLGLLVHTPLI